MSKKIKEGNHVLLFLDRRRTFLITVKKKQDLHTHKGFIRLDNLVGKHYGDRVKTNLGVEFVLLKPSIRDYVMKMLRRTQIIYPKDMALIVLHTGIGPGSRVVEAGTGSGALTSYVAHYVKPDGHVYSYEARKEFVKNAKKNIAKAGLLEYVKIKNKDITQSISEKNVDAVILDLATPWLVVPHAYKALKGGGAIASFSPTIDQVVKTVEELQETGFVDIETIECLTRRIQVIRDQTRPESLMIGHTGYMTFARKAL